MGLYAKWSAMLAATAVALSLATGAHAESAADRAVKEAQKYRDRRSPSSGRRACSRSTR